MKTVNFFQEMFHTAIARYVSNISRREDKYGFYLHGTFTSPKTGNEHPFYYRESKQNSFAPNVFVFQITEGPYWGSMFSVDITDAGFWCESIDVFENWNAENYNNISKEDTKKLFEMFVNADWEPLRKTSAS